jgi:hypothetical protein
MPALVNIKVGSSLMIIGADGTISWPLFLKNVKNVLRTCAGDMLLQVDQPAEAVTAFEASLTISPNRFNSLSGAARAAALIGDRAKAVSYSRLLLDVNTLGDRPDETASRMP